ncbi:MAG TPA: intradiol ring-cleavage dioxygenase [Chryseosolibacter sp.]|nr:intradiol ring-cleavage dioxygenase [Chryseosolibacter sp.]
MKRKSFITALGLLPVARVFGGVQVPFLSNTCKTQRDQEGPFYKDGAPERNRIETNGAPLRIRGRVIRADDCQTPVANAVLDIWHCDNQGDYDNEGFKCRGLVKSDAAGNYQFTTIFPPSYGRRPRHIHFKVRAGGFPELTSQIYFKGDPNIKNDFARNAEESRVIELKMENDIRVGVFDIYI